MKTESRGCTKTLQDCPTCPCVDWCTGIRSLGSSVCAMSAADKAIQQCIDRRRAKKRAKSARLRARWESVSDVGFMLCIVALTYFCMWLIGSAAQGM